MNEIIIVFALLAVFIFMLWAIVDPVVDDWTEDFDYRPYWEEEKPKKEDEHD